MQQLRPFIFLPLFFLFTTAQADSQFDTGYRGIQSRTGCYIVDYSYTETESLKAGYALDPRVYDVNRDKTVKEWIYSEVISPTRIRLQHILFATDASGKIAEGSFLKHQAEDWEYDAPFLYDFTQPSTWLVKKLDPSIHQWTRRITNLDDGLRYQCAASWLENREYSEWSCDNYSPIPGRETRDMGRKDYNTLQRSTRILSYGKSWLERQENVKTIDQNGVRTPLARETGKNWYIRLPDSECADARAFVEPRIEFWHLLRETWDQVFTGESSFIENTVGKPPRFVKMSEIEERAMKMNLNDASHRVSIQKEILTTIQEYRK